MSRSTRSHSRALAQPDIHDQFSLLLRRDLSHNLGQASKRYIGLLRQTNSVERPLTEMIRNMISNLNTLVQDADKRMNICHQEMQHMSRLRGPLRKFEPKKSRDEMTDVEEESTSYSEGKYKRRRQDMPQPHKSILRQESKRFPKQLALRLSASPAPRPAHHKQRPSTLLPVPKYFAHNPLTCPDPTEYEIRKVPPDATVEEKKNCYNVAEFPGSDLSEYLPAPLPNKDLSRSRPQTQAPLNILMNHIDPYVRKMDDTNLQFLTDKGDRLTPFLLPPRGKNKYREIIQRERQLRTGARHDRLSPIADDEQATTDDTEIEHDNHELDDQLTELPLLLDRLHYVLGRTALAHQFELENSAGNTSDNANYASLRTRRTRSYSKTVPTSSGYVQLNERLQAELRDPGTGTAQPSNNGPQNAERGETEDELAIEIRHLQHHLRRQIVINDARKKRVLEIARDYLAYQEYMAIKNDLDAQLEHAYQRRLRTTEGRGAKRVISYSESSSEQAASEANKRTAIGESIRMLMDRRHRWVRCIGPLFRNCSFTTLPGKGETIFDPTVMKSYLKKDLQQKGNDKDG